MKNTDSGFILFRVMKITIWSLSLAAVIVAAYISFMFGAAVFSEEPMTVQRTEHVSYDITIEEGESVLSVGKDLEAHGIIKSAFVFWAQTKVYECTIGPGTYTVNSRNCSKDIAKQLSSKYKQSLQGEQ